MPMVQRMVAIALPARKRVLTTACRPGEYLISLRILQKPNGRANASLLLPDAGKQLAIAPMARNASKQFQKPIHRLCHHNISA